MALTRSRPNRCQEKPPAMHTKLRGGAPFFRRFPCIHTPPGGPRPPYNRRMEHVFCSFLRPLGRLQLAAALVMLPLAAAQAQTQAPAQKSAAPTAAPEAPARGSRPDRAIERIRTEDAGARIDELRVGGETQQITIQPKTRAPAYEVKPAEGARGKAPAAGSSDTNGSRVWNFLKF
jgi:hypothetical protein